MSKQQRTYQCRLSVGPLEDVLLAKYASLFNKAQRALFGKLQAGGDLTDLKGEFLQEFRITARQFNGMSAQLKGKIASIKERRRGIIEEAQQRIARAKKVLKKIHDPAKHHQKKRRIATLQQRLARIKEDHASGRVRLCFGSRKLFRAQFEIEANGYASHDEWLRDWQAARASQFFVIGSRDETAGCQSCVATIGEDGSISLRLRLAGALWEYGKYLSLRGIRLQYGHEAIVAAIGRNLSANKQLWQAINYRFVKDNKGWRVFVTVAMPEVPLRSHKNTGVIGIDINADNLAVTETDRFGNPLEYFSLPCITYGKTAEQRRAVIGDTMKLVVAFAEDRRKPLILEKLDFQKKKAEVEKQSPVYARMLSALAYTQIQRILRARALDAGMEVLEVNPAYTSVIGQYKFADRYGMSRHNASALVIGRRSLDFGEALPSQLYGTLPLSVRNRGRHVWSKWAVVSRKAPAAPAAHGWSGMPRSSPLPVPDKGTACDLPPITGEIPICESSLELFE